MNPSLTFTLSLFMAFGSIFCSPSHAGSPSRHAMAVKHRRADQGLGENLLIPNSYTFFIKRSLSPYGNSQDKLDQKLAERSNVEDEEDCDEDEDDETASSDSSSNSTANAQTANVTNSSTDAVPDDNKSADAKPAPTTASDATSSAAPSSNGSSASIGISASIDIGSSTSSSSSSSSETYNGKATFFTQGGVAGACGTVHSDSDYIVAIDSAMYNGGQFCGKTILVTRISTGKSIKCTGADECPGCPSSTSLDLSTGAFNALGSPDEGVFDIKWQVVS